MHDAGPQPTPVPQGLHQSWTGERIEVATGIAQPDTDEADGTNLEGDADERVKPHSSRDNVAAQVHRVDGHILRDLRLNERQLLMQPPRITPMTLARGVPVPNDAHARDDLHPWMRLHGCPRMGRRVQGDDLT